MDFSGVAMQNYYCVFSKTLTPLMKVASTGMLNKVESGAVSKSDFKITKSASLLVSREPFSFSSNML